MKHQAKIIVALLLATALAGCDKAGDVAQADPAADKQQASDQGAGAPAVVKAADAELPKGDKNKPQDQFVELNSGVQLMQAYYAFSGLPIPYEKLAEQSSVDYRQTSDAFKKQDILKALQPKLEQEIQAVKANPYLMIRTQVMLKNYDMQRKAFPLTGFEADSYLSFNDGDAALSFTNTDDFQFYPQTDEAKAREMEAIVSKNAYARYPARAYIYIQDARDQSGRRMVRAQLLKLVVETPDGQPLLAL